MKLIVPPTSAPFTSEHHQLLLNAAAPTTVSLVGVGGEGSVIHPEIAQERAGGDESEDEEVWTTVHVREVGLWIMGSHAKDGGYVSIGGVHFGTGGSH